MSDEIHDPRRGESGHLAALETAAVEAPETTAPQVSAEIEAQAKADRSGGEVAAEMEASDEERYLQLVVELDELTEQVRSMAPDYEPPPFSPKALMALLEDILSKYPRDVQLGVLQRLRSAVSQDVFDLDVWKGVWYMLNYTVRYNADLARRRFTGEYETDRWGLDWELIDVLRPISDFLYKYYWRVEISGIENIPMEGRALLVANHSGQLPFDGMMVMAAVMNDHPAQRLVRTLYAALLPRIPWVSTLLVRMGQSLAAVENGTRLLEEEELVAVFPEGYKGTGKLYKDRYRLARFGRGGFVKMALNTGAPIIPVSVVGSEETYISLAKFPTFAGITGIPYLPITLRFPWLGLLGIVPLPTKWYIDFGEPIAMDGYGPDAAQDLALISQQTDQVRNTVQEMIFERLAQRRHVFFG
jgi:1-acyl-sn-glycerol-3-phosphate acyltransferase